MAAATSVVSGAVESESRHAATVSAEATNAAGAGTVTACDGSRPAASRSAAHLASRGDEESVPESGRASRARSRPSMSSRTIPLPGYAWGGSMRLGFESQSSSIRNAEGLQRRQYCFAGSGWPNVFFLVAASESARDVESFAVGAYRMPSAEYLGAGCPVRRVRISSARTERML